MEGIPEKAVKGYAVLSGFRGSKLPNTDLKERRIFGIKEVETENITWENEGPTMMRNTYILVSQLPLEYCDNSDTAWFGELT